MDEILASIRRIIESGDDRGSGHRLPDPGVNVGFRTTPAEPPLRAERVDDQNGSPFGRLGTSPRIEQAEAAPTAFGATDEDREAFEDVDRSIELDESWHRLRTGEENIDDRTGDLKPVSVATDEAPGYPHTSALAAENENRLPQATRRDFTHEFDDAAFEAELRGETWSSSVEPEPAPSDAVVDLPTAPSSRSSSMPESVIEGASALLSAEAGNQVAAAFDDLAHAIRDGQMRSMEEMAREMLRPMLREWLDDNLPRMVERLVREEIERIARGPRR